MVATLVDLDLRIASFPQTDQRADLQQWLDHVGIAIVNGTSNGEPVLGSNGGHNTIAVLENHVKAAEFYYRNFRLALSVAWLARVVIWGTIAVVPSVTDLPGIDSGIEFASLARVWILIFVAGIAGSALAVLWRITVSGSRTRK